MSSRGSGAPSSNSSRAAPTSRTPTPRAVKAEGNEAAREMLDRVFELTDRRWRGMGRLPASGWRLCEEYGRFDAELRFGVDDIEVEEATVCRSGEVLTGAIKPHECEAFGTSCTPAHPLGATMVSSEGACAAYHRYRRVEVGTGSGLGDGLG